MSKPNIAHKTQTAGFMIFSSLMLLVLSSVVLGLFLNRVQIRENSQLAPTRRIQDLVTLLKQAEAKRVTLEAEVAQLQRSPGRARLMGKSVNGSDPELQKLYKMAGFTAETGPGIMITLVDNKNQKDKNDSHADPNSGKLQADDILKLVNELKAAGAQALSINDQRLILTSEIITAGPTILVNQTRLTQPVVIKALGNPDLLMSALKIRGGILEYLDFFNIKVTLDKQPKLSIPAYKGALPA